MRILSGATLKCQIENVEKQSLVRISTVKEIEPGTIRFVHYG